MSLFSTLDFWSTQCGENEKFGFDSMVVADLEESGNDYIITGSFNGLLRVYQGNNKDADRSFKPSNLMIEMQLSNPIIQVFVGKLVRFVCSLIFLSTAIMRSCLICDFITVVLVLYILELYSLLVYAFTICFQLLDLLIMDISLI